MSEGRALVLPMQISLMARPMRLPDGRHVLTVSSLFAFRLADHAPLRPAEWFEALATRVHPDTPGDTVCPLPGAELVVLGPVPAVSRDERERACFVQAGEIERGFVLRPNEGDPQSPVLVPDYLHAARDEETNPEGRVGNEDGPPPAILDALDDTKPLWLGTTPFEHPLRLQGMGEMDPDGATGWPPGTDPWILGDAHPAFRTRRLDPGDRVVLDGLLDDEVSIPPYRIEITSGSDSGAFRVEPARIHVLALIPCAGIGAMIWRVAIDVAPEDSLGLEVVALVAALVDAEEERQDEDHWGRIAVGRWLDPTKALDDRPLLPRKLARAIVLPFAPPGPDDPILQRHAAAKDWMESEMGAPAENPFEPLVAKEIAPADKALEQNADEESAPDVESVESIADEVLALARSRHADAGFDPEKRESVKPVKRGPVLEAEIDRRLERPYQSEIEITLHAQLCRDAMREAGGPDADETVEKMASIREMNPSPAPPFAPLVKREARRFGDEMLTRLARGNLPSRHIDVSGARFTEKGARVEDRQLDGLLAERTIWKDVQLRRCEITGGSLAGSEFEGCRFEDCNLVGVNLCGVELARVEFIRCSLRDLQINEPTWHGCRFEDCTFENVTMTDVAANEIEVRGGSWTHVRMSDALWIESKMTSVVLEDVTLSDVHAAKSRLEQVKMHKVYVATKGFSLSEFIDVEADTCGFLSYARFDETKFTRCRFTRTGFTRANFTDAVMDPSCRFVQCDLTGAGFVRTVMDGVRFAQCTFLASLWLEHVSARDAWLYQCALGGVDLRKVELARAVLSDSDLTDTQLDPARTIGVDLRGTVHGSGSA